MFKKYNFIIFGLPLFCSILLGNGVHLNNLAIFATENEEDKNSSCFEKFLGGQDIQTLVHDFGGESLSDIVGDFFQFGISKSALEEYLNNVLEISQQDIVSLVQCEKDIGIKFVP